MGFWTAIMIIVVVGIVTEFILRVVKMGTRYSENVKRIKHGYPTLDGTYPMGYEASEQAPEPREHRLQ